MGDPIHSADSVAEDLMARGGLVSEEPWEGEPEDEKQHFVQEELYIHAKLLIVDDRTVICGSSNLNDRSQLGSHDSELSIVMQDTRVLESTMDGQPFQAGYHAATLRRHLWREHLGMIEAQTLDAKDDPNAQPPTVAMNDEYSGEEWEFVADPVENIRTWNDYDTFAPRKSVKQGHLHDPYMPAAKVREELDKIRGHLVWMPMGFLEEEKMAEWGMQVNSVTESVYT